jgi:2-oxoglutarate ferredoxin oxidoreductase subunit alpha
MNTEEFNWKVAGFAGEGIMTTGLLFSKTCARHGWQIFDYTEYPSLIRGGHNTYQVYANQNQAFAQKRNVDLLVALNRNALTFHKDELSNNSLVLYDQEDDNIDIGHYNLPGKSLNLPMVRLASDVGAQRLMANNVALGASIYLLGLDLNILDSVIADVFGKKGDKVVNLNVNAAKAGYDYASQNSQPLFKIEKRENQNLITLTGNEAIGLGAIAGGLQLYVAYPMTPASSILHFLAAKAKPGNFVVKHAEDEISSVNMALGASFAGVRTMVGTSGGGFCYMTEALGLSGVAELPLVIVEAMRPGPALGMPTWTAQADLQFVLNAGHDEFPRFVLTPGDGEEAFHLTRKALELSEKYQTLVLLVSDKYLSESRHTLKLSTLVFENQRFAFADNPQSDETGFFPRYLETENGISPRTVPGTPEGVHVANSYEHDQYGLGTEDPQTRKAQMDKRFRKLEEMKKEIPTPLYETQPGASLTLISFGSTKGVIRQAREKLMSQGVPTNMLHLSWIWPFPKDQVASVIDQSPRTVVVEGNREGQLAKLITQETGKALNYHLRRYDGRPFYVEDLIEYVKTFKP